LARLRRQTPLLHQIRKQQHPQIAGWTRIGPEETGPDLQPGRPFAIVIVSRSGHNRR
jgi:hypothetical protein